MKHDLENDSRWQRLNQRSWRCSGCGRDQSGLFDLVSDHPASCSGQGTTVSNSELRPDKSILSDDFCIVDGEHYFIRCVLHLPIIGGAGSFFGFGVWTSLSPVNFATYAETFNDGTQGALGPWFGWLSSQLKGYPDTFLLKVMVRPQNERRRPEIELEPTSHPLALEQREGLTLDRILQLYALNGHDISEVLADG